LFSYYINLTKKTALKSTDFRPSGYAGQSPVLYVYLMPSRVPKTPFPTTADEAPDDGQTLLQQLKKDSTKTLQNGAAFRWAVGADEDKVVTLYLQSLPSLLQQSGRISLVIWLRKKRDPKQNCLSPSRHKKMFLKKAGPNPNTRI